MNIYLPNNLKLPSSTLFKEHYEDALYFIHLIFRERIYNKRGINDYIELKMAYLRKQLDSRYADEILAKLIIYNIVECDNRYQIGKKSRGYRLAKKLRIAQHVIIELSDRWLLRRLNKWYSHLEGERPITVPVHQRLKQNLQMIEVDYQAGCNFAAMERALAKDEAAINRYVTSLHALDVINKKDFFFHYDDYGRVHTNISNLYRGLRQFLSVDNEGLVEVDIANSQPLLLALLTINWLNNGKRCVTNLTVTNNLLNFNPLNQEFRVLGLYDATFLEGFRLVSGVGYPPDLLLYLELCSQGNCYEFLMEKAVIDDREVIKNDLFTLLFNKPQYHTDAHCFEAFQSNFPTLLECATWLKRKDHCHLSHQLQTLESKIVIHGVARRLTEQGIFVTTIHDSLLLKKCDVPLAKQYLTEEFSLCGANVTIKTKSHHRQLSSYTELPTKSLHHSTRMHHL